MSEHKEGRGSGFTKRHKISRLVYYEMLDDPLSAIAREKQIKGGSRARKVALVKNVNPDWRDLWGSLQDDPPM